QQILAQVRAGTSFTGDVVQSAKDGRHIHSLCRWVWDPDSELVLTSYMDISERKRAEELARKAQEQLERQAGELERLVQEKTENLQQAVFQMEEFSYTVSHDLRAPLRAMQSFARALLEDYGDRFQGEAKEYLER